MEEAIVPEIYNPSLIDVQEMIESEEAIEMARQIIAKEGIFVKNTEGKGNTGWILMDFGDVIVNVFTEEKRAHYNIERLWGDCPRVEFETIEE